VDGGNRLLLRFTPAPGYYLYRDRTSLALEGLPGVRTGKPQWPAGKSYQDEYFGNVVVYFDQVDVPLPLRREQVEGGAATLVATFQGCQTDGVRYPPMPGRGRRELPAGKRSQPSEAAGANLVTPPLPSGKKNTASVTTRPESEPEPAPQPL